MRRLLLLVVLVLAAVLWAQYNITDYGRAVFTYGGWRVETNLLVLAGGLLLSYLLLAVALRLIFGVIRLPRWLRDRRLGSGQRRTRSELTRGLMALAEGHPGEAEKILLRHAPQAEAPQLHYLAGALAAQAQQALERRDDYLRRASETCPEAALAIALTAARLYLQSGEEGRALETLEQLLAQTPRQDEALRLIAPLYARQGRFDALDALMPALRKARALPEAELESFERQITVARLRVLGPEGPDAVARYCKGLRKPLASCDEVVLEEAAQLAAHGQPAQAEALLARQLGWRFSEAVARAWAQLESANPAQGLLQAESWLKHHPDSVALNRAAGRLSARQQLWGKARDYLLAALALEPSPETLAELLALHEKQGDLAGALRLCHEYMSARLPVSVSPESRPA